MTNALAVYEQMGALQTAANALHASGFFGDVKTQAQAMVKVMAGAEIGLPPFASMTGIHIVQGKPVIGANLIATLVKNDPRYDYRVARADNEACIIEWHESGRMVGQSSFTMQEANAAGLTNKPTWKAYPSDMLFARALTRGARRYAPGIFGGSPIYTPDELGVETDEDGAIIQGEIVNVTPAPQQAPAANDAAAAIDEEIAAAEGRAFVPLAAQLLEITEASVKDRMKALGYTFIPGKPELRVQAFHKVREYRPAANGDGQLFDMEPAPAALGAYQE